MMPWYKAGTFPAVLWLWAWHTHGLCSLVTILEQESLEYMQDPGDLPGHWAVSTASGT